MIENNLAYEVIIIEAEQKLNCDFFLEKRTEDNSGNL